MAGAATSSRQDFENLTRIERFLRDQGLEPVRSSRFTASEASERSARLYPNSAVLVDEMGFLLELYSAANWAIVGGGWGPGVHSTIEPAIHGIPIAAGAKNAHRFSEVGELVRTGQLSLLRTPKDRSAWIASLESSGGPGRRQIWQAQAIERLGATQRLAGLIKLSLSERHVTLET